MTKPSPLEAASEERARSVAWLDKMAQVHRDYLAAPGAYAQEARTSLSTAEFYRDQIAAGEHDYVDLPRMKKGD